MAGFFKVTTADGQHEIYVNMYAIAYAKFHTAKGAEGGQRRGTAFLFGGEHGYFGVQGASAEALEAALAEHQLAE
jgi:hypothetical protein